MTDPETLDVTIVDGYVDEPAHFGVPPYISTYPRYAAGALVDAGVPREQITYHTIDELREDNAVWRDVEAADLMVYVGGMTVPGKYVGGTPAEPDEVRELAWSANGTSMMGGPVRFGVGEANEGASETARDDLDFDFLAMADVEAAVFDLVESGLEGFDDRYRDIEDATAGPPGRVRGRTAPEPPRPPHLRDGDLAGLCLPLFVLYRTAVRQPRVPHRRLRRQGGREPLRPRRAHFRLGRQADILAFGGDGEAPNPDALRRLYGGIREVAPDLGRSTSTTSTPSPSSVAREVPRGAPHHRRAQHGRRHRGVRPRIRRPRGAGGEQPQRHRRRVFRGGQNRQRGRRLATRRRPRGRAPTARTPRTDCRSSSPASTSSTG